VTLSNKRSAYGKTPFFPITLKNYDDKHKGGDEKKDIPRDKRYEKAASG
jgi:hypothetical protein